MQNGFEEDCQMDPRFTKHILPYFLYLNHATSLAFNCLLGFIFIEVLSNRPHMFELQWRKKFGGFFNGQLIVARRVARYRTIQNYPLPRANFGGLSVKITLEDVRSAFHPKRMPCSRGDF